MSMMGYKATMFMIFFNYAMIIAKYIGTQIFPNSPQPIVADIPILSNIQSFTGDTTIGTITTLMLTAGVLALFAFSLLVPTVQFVFLFFGLSTIITNVYILQLANYIPWVFLLPLSMGVTIVYYVGMTQYAARSAFSGS